MAHTGPSRAQNWDNSLHESDNAPAVDEWGREIRRRRRSTSSEEENREYDLPGERSMHINATGYVFTLVLACRLLTLGQSRSL
jgi:hypothetical protein